MLRHQEQRWWRSPIGIGTIGFLGVAGFFLLTGNTAHVFGALPWLLLAACPLIHLFMHHGHGHGGHDHSGGAGDSGSGPEQKVLSQAPARARFT